MTIKERKPGSPQAGILFVFLAWALHAGFAPFSDLYGLFVVLGAVYFIISFFSTAFGLAILAVAMLFSPEIALGAVGRRALTIRIEDILIVVLTLAWLAQAAVKRKKLIMGSPLNKPLCWLVLVSALSTAIGYWRGTVDFLPGLFYQAKIIEYFVLFYLVLNYVQSEKQIKIFLFFTLLTVALLAVYTLIQVPSTEMFTARRISAPFEGKPQPATAGGYLAFSFFLAFSMMLYQKFFFKRMLLLVLSVMVLIPLLYTFSRTAYVALAGGLIFMAWLLNVRWIRWLIAVVLLASPVLLPGAVKARIAYTWEDAKNVNRNLGVDFSFQERIYAFRRAGNALKINPVLGLGIASWEYPDNQYARTLHEIGILGLFLWLLIFFRLYRIGRWLYDFFPSGTLKGLALGYAVGVAGLLLHAWGSCTFYIVRIMEPFWFVSGLVVALYNIKAAEACAGLAPSVPPHD